MATRAKVGQVDSVGQQHFGGIAERGHISRIAEHDDLVEVVLNGVAERRLASELAVPVGRGRRIGENGRVERVADDRRS